MHIDFKSFRHGDKQYRRTMDTGSPKMDQEQYRLDPLLLEQPPRRRNTGLKEKPTLPDQKKIQDIENWILWPGIVYKAECHNKHPNPNHIKVYTDQKGKPIQIGWASHSVYHNKQRERRTSAYFIYIHIPTIKYHSVSIQDLYICQIRPYRGTDYLMISLSTFGGSKGSILNQITFPEKKLSLLSKNNGPSLPPHRPPITHSDL